MLIGILSKDIERLKNDYIFLTEEYLGNFTDIVSKFRKKNKMTNRQLAIKAKLTLAQYERIMRCKHGVSIQSIVKLGLAAGYRVELKLEKT
jgi:hypothetical protein